MQAKRNCKSCDETFVGGRADKKFCSVECRNNHFNSRHRDQTNAMRNVNNILRRNRLILERFQAEGHIKLHRNMLQGAGFQFDYFTSVSRSRSGQLFNFCYEQGFLEIENDMYSLITKLQFDELNRKPTCMENERPARGRVRQLRIA